MESAVYKAATALFRADNGPDGLADPAFLHGGIWKGLAPPKTPAPFLVGFLSAYVEDQASPVIASGAFSVCTYSPSTTREGKLLEPSSARPYLDRLQTVYDGWGVVVIAEGLRWRVTFKRMGELFIRNDGALLQHASTFTFRCVELTE